jgi:hypothetical protein
MGSKPIGPAIDSPLSRESIASIFPCGNYAKSAFFELQCGPRRDAGNNDRRNSPNNFLRRPFHVAMIFMQASGRGFSAKLKKP